MITAHDAVLKLYPQVIVIRGDIAYDANNQVVDYDKAVVQAYLDDNAYKDLRAKSYPSIAEQLDTLYHQGIDGWKATITAVKEEFPKP